MTNYVFYKKPILKRPTTYEPMFLSERNFECGQLSYFSRLPIFQGSCHAIRNNSKNVNSHSQAETILHLGIKNIAFDDFEH